MPDFNKPIDYIELHIPDGPVVAYYHKPWIKFREYMRCIDLTNIESFRIGYDKYYSTIAISISDYTMNIDNITKDTDYRVEAYSNLFLNVIQDAKDNTCNLNSLKL